MRVRIQHTSLQFSDTNPQHVHDAQAVFERARNKGVWACTGTEATQAMGNHDLRDALIKSAKKHGFYIQAHPAGEWVALNREFMDTFVKGFSGPFIESGGRGKHAPRGVAWASAQAREKDLGRLTFGAAHYLTDRSEAISGSNSPMVKGITRWAQIKGRAGRVVFLGADANTNDRLKDVFSHGPLTSIADELKKWPATHEGGTVIDVIASYDRDRRVKAKAYYVLNDSEFKMYSDHYLLDAIYEVEPRA